MSVSWNDVSEFIGDAAPLIGKLLPIPGAGLVGELVGKALGTEPKPDKVLAAMKTDPSALVKLAEIEASNEQRLTELALSAASNDLAEVNKTMRVEAASDNKWTAGWRPYWGYVSGTAFGIQCLAICVILGKAVWEQDWQLLSYIPQIIGALAALWSVPMIILGVASHHRGKLHRIRAGEDQKPGILGQMFNRGSNGG